MRKEEEILRNKIYIACPAQAKTGGPELLHQLCHKLNNFGYKAFMYYYGEGIDNPINDAYKFYGNPYVTNVMDDNNNIVIVPEVNINLLKKFKLAKRIIWWLSVDNYLASKKGKKAKIKSLFGLLDLDFREQDIIHLAQSHYAIDFLIKNNLNKESIYYLSDYLNKTFIENCKNEHENSKKNNILYNPKKGFEFTKLLINKNQNLNWIPLENLTSIEMSNLMKESKVYIDFGNHPGKDRIPREAAISGACIVTGKKGSAKYFEDVTIPQEFKFDDDISSLENIISKIEYILLNYENEYNKFSEYREKILNEENKFEDDIKEVFSKILNI